jgi:hypothetical protein
MLIGSRVTYPEEVGLWNVEFLQISVYHSMKDNLNQMRNCACMCKEAGIRYVVHPIEYFVLDKETFRDLKVMAECADLALILHDEKTFEGKRLTGEHEITFRTALNELRSVASISFENATDTMDVLWFWHKYADSITIDIGHVESAGLDSVEFVKSLDREIIEKIQFVHIHRNNGWRKGLTDHWPILPDCRELKALRELLKRKYDVGVILEINETEMILDNLNLLKKLRNELSR